MTVKATYPSNNTTQPRDALMFIEFDQRIDPAAVLSNIRVTGSNRKMKTRLATPEEVKQERDRDRRSPLSQAENGKWLAFRAVDPKTGELALPSNSRIIVSLPAGAPSAEGPGLTQRGYDFSFSTYGPFKVTNHNCGPHNRCKVYSSFYIEFSNELTDIDASKIIVEPELGEMSTFVYNSTLRIDGTKRGNTTYRITLDRSIADKFNQTLGRDHTFTFYVGPSPRHFIGPDTFQVMDPAAPASCSVFSLNYTRLKTISL